MKCWNCGAENPDHAVYCGSCASDLRSREPGETTPTSASTTQSDDHTAASKRQLKTLSLVFIILSGLSIAFAAMTFASDQPDYVMLFMGVIWFLSGFFFLWLSTSEQMLGHFRLRGWVGHVKAEVTGFNLNNMGVMLAVVPVGLVLVWIMYPTDEAPLAYIIVLYLAIVLVAYALVLFGSKVTVESGGICSGPKHFNRMFIPFSRVSSTRLSGRVLTVTLARRMTLSFRTFKFLLLGDLSNFESELGKARTTAVLGPRASLSPPPGTTKPIIAGVLLVVSGCFAILTGALFFHWMDLLGLTEPMPPLLECCAWLEFLFGGIILIAGIVSFTRRHYGLVRAGAILSIISVGGGVSLVLGIVALILLLTSKDEYEN